MPFPFGSSKTETKEIKRIPITRFSKLRRRLAWFLIGKNLQFRLKGIEDVIDGAQKKMDELDTENKDYETWSSMYFRYYELHSEVSGLIDWLTM